VVFLGLGPITPTLQAILKQLHSVSINCVMNPSDAVDLESPRTVYYTLSICLNQGFSTCGPQKNF